MSGQADRGNVFLWICVSVGVCLGVHECVRECVCAYVLTCVCVFVFVFVCVIFYKGHQVGLLSRTEIDIYSSEVSGTFQKPSLRVQRSVRNLRAHVCQAHTSMSLIFHVSLPHPTPPMRVTVHLEKKNHYTLL